MHMTLTSVRAGTLVAVVDNNPGFIRLIEVFCHSEGLRSIGLASNANTLNALSRARPAHILIDLWLGRRSEGLEVIRLIRTRAELQASTIVVCSADHDQIKAHREELAMLGCCLLAKPFSLDDLRQVLL
jgi:CheY-like chemotaxis protein